MDHASVGQGNGYYDRQYSVDDLQRLADMNNNETLMGMMASGGMDLSGTGMAGGGQSYDPMMQRSSKDANRRRSFSTSSPFHSRPGMPEPDPRRSSMLEFGSNNDSPLESFQFDPTPPPPPPPSSNGIQRTGSIAQRRLDSQRARQQQQQRSDAGLGLSTSFPTMSSPFHSMSNSSPYSATQADSMGLDMGNNYMTNSMLMGLDFGGTSMDNGVNGGITPRSAYNGNSFSTGMHSSPVQQGQSSQVNGHMHDPGGGQATNSMSSQGMMDKVSDVNLSDQIHSMSRQLSQQGMQMPSSNSGMSMQSDGMNQLNQMNKGQPATNLDISSDVNGVPIQNQNSANAQVVPQYRNAYSSSGFDMLGVLMRVATRPKPQINIGAVDMSCAFVVCDVTMHDIPIVYCSDVFERLTAYTRHEILGRNCRFLQAPDGKIKAGVKRKYVDDQSVYRIKKMITQRQETQISVINYRKGGQPFMNLLTMIPITWDTDEVKYYVGFQVDLVEQPQSVTNKNPDGTYAINYQRGPTLPRYIIPDSQNHSNADLGQTVNRDDVSTVLSTIGSGESELSKRIWDKVLLENTDDVVHVLSLKGLFLYLSPSSRRVLEYDPAELVGTALSSVCHPSDIVPVTRELKDTSTGAAVNVVFRIRRKHSGYTWFESHGSLHLEQGKGRKCIIMVGRERPVYALARNDVNHVGGIGESELWTKMSTSGMFLFVSSNVRSLLDRQPEDLVGSSAQTLMRSESRVEFGKKLELARTGVRATFKHDVQNRRGQTLQAQTTIYPGDACEGQKPTFLVAQTRLLKLSRGGNRPNANISPKPADQKSLSPVSSASAISGGQTPSSGPGNIYHEGVTTSAGGSGLAIGTQHEALASDDNVFDELKTTRSTSWQFELRQMEKRNRLLAEELQSLLSNKKKRKRRNGAGNMQKDCVNCHTRVTPEWRRGPSGNRDLCNSCGLRWAKENGRVTPRNSSQQSDKSASPSRSNSMNATLSTSAPGAVDQSTAPTSNPTNPTTNGSSQLTGQERPSPKMQTTANTDSHNSKVARMEATASEGFGGGIPPKIEEGVEPPMGDARMAGIMRGFG